MPRWRIEIDDRFWMPKQPTERFVGVSNKTTTNDLLNMYRRIRGTYNYRYGGWAHTGQGERRYNKNFRSIRTFIEWFKTLSTTTVYNYQKGMLTTPTGVHWHFLDDDNWYTSDTMNEEITEGNPPYVSDYRHFTRIIP